MLRATLEFFKAELFKQQWLAHWPGQSYTHGTNYDEPVTYIGDTGIALSLLTQLIKGE